MSGGGLPLNIVLPTPQGLIAPWSSVSISSADLFDVPSGAVWQVDLYSGSEATSTNTHWQAIWHANFPFTSVDIGINPPGLVSSSINSGISWRPGTTVKIDAQLKSGSTVIESGTISGEWQPVSSILLQPKPSAGGLTTAQAAQLTQVENNTNAQQTQWTEYQEVTLPSLNSVLTNITTAVTSTVLQGGELVAKTIGSLFDFVTPGDFGVFNPTGGPTCDPIDYNIGGASYFGLTVNLTTIPDYYTKLTPAFDWTPQDLAVLKIERSGSQTVRYGIHTQSFSVSDLPDMQPVSFAGVGVPVAPPNYHIKVDFAAGVCGELLLYYLP